MNSGFEKNTAHAEQITEGSTLYYALLYVDNATRIKALDTINFTHAISSVLFDVSEPQIAEKKIHWWHEELARLSKKSARHPAAIKVQNHLHDSESMKACLEILSAASAERFTPFTDDAALRSKLIEDYSARARLLESVFSNSNTPDISEELALGMGQFYRLQSIVSGLRQGYAVFSDERYAEHSLSPEDLLSYSNGIIEGKDATTLASNANIRTLITAAIAEAELTLSSAVSAANFQTTSLPLQIMIRIRRAQLRLWKKRTPDLLGETLSLTPLRKFFIAYRSKRRFAKSA